MEEQENMWSIMLLLPILNYTGFRFYISTKIIKY